MDRFKMCERVFDSRLPSITVNYTSDDKPLVADATPEFASLVRFYFIDRLAASPFPGGGGGAGG